MKTICEVAKAPIPMQISTAAIVTTRPVRSRPSATASRFEAPASRASLIRVEQEDAVVGRDPEGEREQDQRLGEVERAWAVVAEQALEASVLEDEHEQRRARP